MPLIIAHRGNLNGPNPNAENHPDYIAASLRTGFGVEIDVWGNYHPDNDTNHVWLGHDEPQYKVPLKFITKPGLFVHCKNVEALWWCKTLGVRHYFFHHKDDCTLTSSGYIWTYPRKDISLNEDSIPVVFTKENMIWPYDQLINCYGICTDDAYYYDALFNHSAI